MFWAMYESRPDVGSSQNMRDGLVKTYIINKEIDDLWKVQVYENNIIFNKRDLRGERQSFPFSSWDAFDASFRIANSRIRTLA